MESLRQRPARAPSGKSAIRRWSFARLSMVTRTSTRASPRGSSASIVTGHATVSFERDFRSSAQDAGRFITPWITRRPRRISVRTLPGSIPTGASPGSASKVYSSPTSAISISRASPAWLRPLCLSTTQSVPSGAALTA
ncbi:hypothetical protein SDC9_161829 [bioreactor metagenome]|uniref:Uncharacterized protein n=1 Tax=bioreactor metagenome TaxID=1076179 RepID=A0A645FLR8_9ZZZZ